VAKGDKGLVGNAGFRRYHKTISEERAAITVRILALPIWRPARRESVPCFGCKAALRPFFDAELVLDHMSAPTPRAGQIAPNR
jgi:hypothetical protein